MLSLIYISNYKSRNINLEKALVYPLTPVPLSLSNAGGSMWKTIKSKLINQIKLHQQETISLDVSEYRTVYIADFIALIWIATKLPDTFE